MYLKIVYENVFKSAVTKYIEGMKILVYVRPINLTYTKSTEPNNSNKIL